MYCRKCGYELADTTQFCGKCGTPVTHTASSDAFSGYPTPDMHAAPSNTELQHKGIALLITILCMIIPAVTGSLLCRKIMCDPIYQIKHVVLEQYGEQTVSQALGKNLESVVWHSEPKGNNLTYVYAQGYMPEKQDTIRLIFTYQKENATTFTYDLERVILMDSDQQFTGYLGWAFFSAYFYDE